MYWLNNRGEWPSVMLSQDMGSVSMRDLQMCNTSYESIMLIETLKLTHRQNMLWVASFHQYCTAQLNKIKLVNDLVIGIHTETLNNTENTLYQLENALITMGDTLERYCQNMSDFQHVNDFTIYYYMEMLHLFNTGSFRGVTTCNLSSNQIEQSSLYYKHLPDLIIIPFLNTTMIENETTTTVNSTSIIDRIKMYSLLDDRYRITMFLTVTDAFAYFLIIPVLLYIILFMKDSKIRIITTRMDSDNEGGEVERRNPLYVDDGIEIELTSKDEIVTSAVNLSETFSSDYSDSEASDKNKKNI